MAMNFEANSESQDEKMIEQQEVSQQPISLSALSDRCNL